MGAEKPTVFAMSITPFDEEGNLDENGFRDHLNRLGDAGVGVYLGSPGSGEGHAITDAERVRVYEIGVEVLKGRVPVHANPPEPRSAQQVLQWMHMAADAGVDCVELYALDAGHGMYPRPDEQLAYYEDVLNEFRHPVALSIHRPRPRGPRKQPSSASWRTSTTRFAQYT